MLSTPLSSTGFLTARGFQDEMRGLLTPQITGFGHKFRGGPAGALFPLEIGHAI